jgi:hypothetical protein
MFFHIQGNKIISSKIWQIVSRKNVKLYKQFVRDYVGFTLKRNFWKIQLIVNMNFLERRICIILQNIRIYEILEEVVFSIFLQNLHENLF